MKSYAWKDLHEGLVDEFSVKLTKDQMQAFREWSGDNNPLHASQEYARANGFKDRVAFGMLTSSFYSRLVGEFLPGERALLHAIEIKFEKPAYEGDTLTVRGKVEYLNEAYKQIWIEAEIKNQSGENISRAKIKVGFRENKQ